MRAGSALQSAIRNPQSAIACLLLLSCARTASSAPTIVPDTAIIIGANTPGPYWISGFFIIEGSAQLAASTQAAPPYILDINTGRIVFAESLSPTDTITITFQRLGFTLQSRWSHSIPAEESPAVGITPVAFVIPSSAPVSPMRPLSMSPRLEWQGHKSFSVTARDGASADWSQGMELTLSGDLLPGLRLSAALSDRQIGNARGYQSHDGSRLGDLDQFYIEAQSRHFHGRWGELQLEQNSASSRRVSGLRTRVDGGGHSFDSYIARPQGEKRRTQITLREGVLGPYPLSGSSAQATIVDGSQAVWLEGGRLSEGADADYTIDAARGTVTLSPRVRFGRESQLTVEYEESLDDYQRTMAGGQWEWRSSDSARSNAIELSWEGDDPSQPLFGSLTESQRATLSHTSNGRVTTPASERVGEHEGDYRVSIIPDNDTVYVYAGPGQGDWRVRFQWVGERRGRYRHLVDNVYEYAGSDLGAYEPTLTLSAPRSQMIVDEALRLAPGRFGGISLDWQGLGVDPNRFSAGSSRFHSNHALAWNLGDPAQRERLSGSLGWISQSQRSVGRDVGLGISQFSDEWRLRGELLESDYDHYALSANAPIAKWLSVRTVSGRFSHASLSAWRTDAAVDLTPSRWGKLAYRTRYRWLTSVEAADSRTTSHEATVQFLPKHLTAEAGWREERVDDPTRTFTYQTDVSTSRWLSLSRNGIIARQEWRDSHEPELDRDERSYESSVGIPATTLRAVSGSGLTFLRGEQAVNGGEAQPYYGARLGGTWNPAQTLQLNADCDLAHRHAGSQREVYIPTRPGQGDYRYERGEYIADSQGDFRRVLVDDEAGDASAYDAIKNFKISWRPNWQGWRWSLDASRRIDARYTANSFAPGEWIVPWADLSNAIMPGARLVVRDDHRLSVQPRSQSRATFILSHERQLAMHASQFTAGSGAGREGSDDHHAWRVETEWREELTQKTYISFGAQYQRRTRDGLALAVIDSDARALITTVGYAPATGVGLAVETRRRLDREFALGQALALWGVRPTARLNLGALSGSLATDWTWLTGDLPGYLSPLLAEGRPMGFSFTESAEVRWQLPRRISLNARLSGDHRPEEPDRWRMQIETVATF